MATVEGAGGARCVFLPISGLFMLTAHIRRALAAIKLVARTAGLGLPGVQLAVVAQGLMTSSPA